VEHDDQPEKVLIAGWAGNMFMGDILAELDAGAACLPQVGGGGVLVGGLPGWLGGGGGGAGEGGRVVWLRKGRRR